MVALVNLACPFLDEDALQVVGRATHAQNALALAPVLAVVRARATTQLNIG